VQEGIKQQTTALNNIRTTIRTTRKNKRLTQKELAESVGISRRYV